MWRLYYYAPNFEKVGSILLSACPSVRASVRPSGFTNEHILFTLHVHWTHVGYIYANGYPILGMLNYLSEIAFMTHWLQCQISVSYPK